MQIIQEEITIEHSRDIDGLYSSMTKILPQDLTINDIVFFCIGTDRLTGDTLGPFVGTFLQKAGYRNIYGTIDESIHALNIKEVALQLPRNKVIIAIDAALGEREDIGRITMKKGPIKPGTGVNKDLGTYGDYAITAIVNAGGFMEHFVVANTSLSGVIRLSEIITEAIIRRFPCLE